MSGKDFRVFFLVSTRYGRLLPEDIETIKLVQKSCSNLGNEFKFSVIINQFPEEDMTRERAEYRRQIAVALERAVLPQEKWGSLHVMFFRNEGVLNDAGPP